MKNLSKRLMVQVVILLFCIQVTNLSILAQEIDPADVNQDGSVNLADLEAIVDSFGEEPILIRDPQPDNVITIYDYAMVVATLVAPYADSVTPEPSPSLQPSIPAGLTPTNGPTPTTGLTPMPTSPPPTPLDIPGEIRLMEWNEPATKNRSGFLEYKPAPAYAQGNWVAPINYAEGTLHFRARVKGMPVEQPGMKLGFCFWQGQNNTPSWGEECAYREPVPGIANTDVQWTRDMTELNPIGGENNSINWTVNRWKYGVIVRNAHNKPVSAKSGMNWNGENPDHWYPLDIRFTIVLVKKNQAFSGWQNYDW